jgi:hypothetical protein
MSTAVLRIHVPLALSDRLNRLAAQARTALGRNVTRAAVVRALLALHADALTLELKAALNVDTVKRGRRAKEAS